MANETILTANHPLIKNDSSCIMHVKGKKKKTSLLGSGSDGNNNDKDHLKDDSSDDDSEDETNKINGDGKSGFNENDGHNSDSSGMSFLKVTREDLDKYLHTESAAGSKLVISGPFVTKNNGSKMYSAVYIIAGSAWYYNLDHLYVTLKTLKQNKRTLSEYINSMKIVNQRKDKFGKDEIKRKTGKSGSNYPHQALHFVLEEKKGHKIGDLVKNVQDDMNMIFLKPKFGKAYLKYLEMKGNRLINTLNEQAAKQGYSDSIKLIQAAAAKLSHFEVEWGKYMDECLLDGTIKQFFEDAGYKNWQEMPPDGRKWAYFKGNFPKWNEISLRNATTR